MKCLSKKFKAGDLVLFTKDGIEARALIMQVEETFETGYIRKAPKTGCKIILAVVGDTTFPRVQFFDLKNKPLSYGLFRENKYLDLQIKLILKA